MDQKEINDILRASGGVPSNVMGADPNDPGGLHWNFGVKPMTDEVSNIVTAAPSFHARFPALEGAWDGKTTINHHDVARKVLGQDMPIQMQPRGTCGSRAGKQSLRFLQCLLIASGKLAKYKDPSHAWIYYAARKMFGMDNGNPSNDNNDGVASGSVPEALAKMGACTAEEANDTNDYGDGSDDLAVSLGCGRQRDISQKLEALAKDNLVTAWTPIKSAKEGADAIAAKGIIIGSDDQGFSMTRDNEGFCRPQGTWMHYHVRSSVVNTSRGRKGFAYNQSWGKNNPQGPLLDGHPSNCFGVDWDVQDQLFRSGDYAALFGFDLWDLESGAVLSWVF